MRNLTIENIEKCCQGTYFGPAQLKNQEVSSITTDSRTVAERCLFVPIKGARADGHDYIDAVYRAGALLCLSEQPLIDSEVPYILVDSTLQAVKDIAEFYRQSLDLKVVGVTGSVGKTSTKEMIAAVLSQQYNTLKTQGNFNNELGLPLTIFRLREEHEVAVLEMGISDFNEMHRLSKIARPDICVITNIGDCHLENLGDRQGVLKAKSEIFDYMQEDGIVILNGDDEHLATLKQVKNQAPIFFGVAKSCDIYADEVADLGLEGLRCQIHLSGHSDSEADAFTVQIPIPGYHMVSNALAAAAVGSALGLSKTLIQQGIEALTPVSGRNHLIRTKHLMIIDDCYNANPVSMKASLDVLKNATGRKVAILGDMFELGSKAAHYHYEVGKYAGDLGVDVIICVGELSRQMASGALASEYHRSVHHFTTKAEVLGQLGKLVKEGDAILVKASHGMEFPELVKGLERLYPSETLK